MESFISGTERPFTSILIEMLLFSQFLHLVREVLIFERLLVLVDADAHLLEYDHLQVLLRLGLLVLGLDLGFQLSQFVVPLQTGLVLVQIDGLVFLFV
jgi:hypothetical protein